MFINPLDASSNTYAESPSDCNYSFYTGAGVTVKFLGVDLMANAEGYIVSNNTNAGYSCSIEGVGCTSGLSCQMFWDNNITMPDPE